MAIKAIVMDMDGTLLSGEKKILPRTKEALIEAQKQGIKVILASGRPLNGMLAYGKELELDRYEGYLVSYNGALVTDCKTGEVLFNQTLSVENSKAILEHLKKFEVIPMIYGEQYMYVSDVYNCMIDYKGAPFNIVEYESRNCNFLLCEQKDLAAFVEKPLNKILVAATPAYLQAHYEEMSAPFKGKCNMVFSADFFYEFTDLGIDKANALRQAFGPMGIEAEHFISFGDGQNDRTIIEYAGVGVAMGNAIDELKEVADFITVTNDEDGIAVALEQYL